jgi:catechol 2,3-dioxygenase-like lactoylglutathione lyase family enzyme
METTELHRGRLIDHLQLVVRDIGASKRFYKAVFQVLRIPLGGEADDHLWADELFISTRESDAALGQLTGRVHLAFQGKDRETVERFHEAARSQRAERTTVRPANASTIRATMVRSCWIPTATTSRSCSTDPRTNRPNP